MSSETHDVSAAIEEVAEDLQDIAKSALQWKKSRGHPIDVEEFRETLDGDLAHDEREYLSFLDRVECVDFDAERGELTLEEEIVRALKAPPEWVETLEREFSGDESAGSAERDQRAESAEGTESDSGAESEPAESNASERTETERGHSVSGSVPGPSELDSTGGASPAPGKPATDEVTSPDEMDRDPTDDTAERPAPETTPDRTFSTDETRYDVLEEVGSGGFGTVYRCRDESLDRSVAVKEISEIFDVFARIDREDVVERFRDLTRGQAQVSHPSVVEVYEVETDRGEPFAVTEYAPNGNLRRFVDDDGRELRIALKYFVQVLHALNAAHDEGLVHGNLKPENILLGTRGNAKVSDFGLAQLVDLDQIGDEIYVGASEVEYTAPEQMRDAEARSPKSDIYSLGIVFYEMLTGRVPDRRSPMPSETIRAVPEEVDDIFDRMSKDRPEARYETAEEILADFYGADSIRRLLDRQSGVVFLLDPIEYGDRQVAGAEKQLSPVSPSPAGAGAEADGDSASERPEPARAESEPEESSASESDEGEVEPETEASASSEESPEISESVEDDDGWFGF